MKVEGFVLAGGRNSRMGRPKATLEIGGRTYLDSAVETLLAFGCETVTIIGGEHHPGIRTLPDATLEPRVSGPIRGLYTALQNAETERIALLAVDLPLVTNQFLERLWKFAAGDIDAVVPVQKDGRVQPLCGFYKASPSLNGCQKALACARLSMHSVLDQIETRAVEFTEYSDLPNAESILLNVNTPDDHAHALAILEGNH